MYANMLLAFVPSFSFFLGQWDSFFSRFPVGEGGVNPAAAAAAAAAAAGGFQQPPAGPQPQGPVPAPAPSDLGAFQSQTGS